MNEIEEVIERQDYNSFKKLIENSQPTDSELAKLLADSIKEGLDDFVSFLLTVGANPNEVSNGNFWNALHLAIEFCHSELIEILLEAGADVNYKDQSGFTPLHHAVDIEADGAYQRDEIPKPIISSILLKNGADPKIEDNLGKTVTTLAKEYDYQAFLKLM